MELDSGRQLEQEIAIFCGLLKELRRSVRETQQYFRDLSSSNGFSPDGKMTDGEGAELDMLTKCSQVILVVGKSSYAKAMVVNRLLKQTLLPCSSCFDETSAKWRDVRIRYHHLEQPRCLLTLPSNFELVDIESGYNVEDTVRVSDLNIAGTDEARNEATLDVKVRNSLLIYGTEIRFIRSWDNGQAAIDSFQKHIQGTLPIVIYALAGKLLQPSEINVLNELKAVIGPEPPILFVSVPALPDVIREHNNLLDSGCELSDTSYSAAADSVPLSQLSNGGGDSYHATDGDTNGTAAESLTLFQQLIDCGFLSIMPLQPDACQVESDFVDNFDSLLKSVTVFSRRVLQCHLARTVSLLNVVQRRCMQMFITMAYDLSRYLQITPKRMEFVKEKEVELYATLNDMAAYKQSELQRIIVETKDSLIPGLLQKAEDYEFLSIELPPSGVLKSSRQLQSCVREMQDLVLGNLSVAIESQLLNSVNVLRDSYMGVLQRCLEHLEDVDQGADLGSTSQALKEILSAAYQIEVTVRGGTSWKTQLVNKIKQVISAVLPKASEKVDAEWRRNLALSMVNSLSDQKLAKSICSQIKDRLSVAHSTFLSSMKRLAEQHMTRQERTEEQQLRVRKVFTPKIARLTLDSTSLKDYILYGLPSYTRELGRGQYGVVYECQQWANYGPCAVKIVLPPDEKHWNDLAMEFCYTKNLPEHERIVSLRGSVIDRAFGSSRCETAVLLIMDRYIKDLYVAIKCGLDTVSRLRVAIDVIEGIRFLHGQGLVHRDVKLKNVLLDENNRGKITDLGFCKPEAMMSGSIVGTPIHMAPELFNGTGKYDGSVDMYAFGILFWYVCAGHVKLPANYERCSSKERLWQDVERGLRPERLPKFDGDCWDIMEQCWQADPQRRPWPGDVEPKIRYIMSRHAEMRGLRRRRERSTPSPFDFDRASTPPLVTD